MSYAQYFAGGDLALAIALVSRWVCAAMACVNVRGQFEEQSS